MRQHETADYQCLLCVFDMKIVSKAPGYDVSVRIFRCSLLLPARSPSRILRPFRISGADLFLYFFFLLVFRFGYTCCRLPIRQLWWSIYVTHFFAIQNGGMARVTWPWNLFLNLGPHLFLERVKVKFCPIWNVYLVNISNRIHTHIVYLK